MPENAKSPTDPKEMQQRLEEFQAKLRAAQDDLERADRLAVVGGLVAEVAHEISTPLASLHSNHDTLAVSVQRLKKAIASCPESPAGTEVEELLSIVDAAVGANLLAFGRIAKIVQSLRVSLRPPETEFVPADILAEIENSLALVAHAFRNRIRLTRDYGTLPEIDCHPGRLCQVFLNVLVNAVQAIEGHGEIRIRAWQEGNTARVAISDTGKGIPVEQLPKIFDSGFTTKSACEGTGLGLSICRGIVQQHGGVIDVESEVERGTTFTIVLPIRQNPERKTNDG